MEYHLLAASAVARLEHIDFRVTVQLIFGKEGIAVAGDIFT
jgi:hypothetical protein